MIEKRESDSRELMPYERPLDAQNFAALGPESTDLRNYVSLAAYWQVLRSRWWVIATVAFVITTIVAIASFRMTSIYRATARVEVDAETPLIQSLNQGAQPSYVDDAFLQTQIQVLKNNDALAWKTIQQLGLASNPAFAGPVASSDAVSEEQRQDLIANFHGQLSAELIHGTRVIAVSFESPNRHLAAQVASALVNNYIDWNFRQKYDATRQASGWMEQQLDELKAKVEKSQQTLVEYERQHAIANVGDKQSVQEQILSDLSKDLTAARSARIQQQALYEQASADPSRVALFAQNPVVQKLQQSAAELHAQYTDLLAQYGPKFPKVVRLQQQIAENEAQVSREQKQVAEQLHAAYLAALSREKLAESAVEHQKTELGDLNQLLVQHNILQRDFESNQQLYQSLLQKLKDATVSAGLRSTNIQVIDNARVPRVPVRPRKTMNIAFGLLVGIGLGTMLAFAVEALDHSIKNAEDVERILQSAILAVIPLERGKVIGARALLRGRDAGNQQEIPGNGIVELTVTHRPRSQMAEAFRSLRTAILLSVASKPPRTLLITSTEPGEGKTSTVLNLAQAFAQNNARVVVVDCDLRKAGIARKLGTNNEKGLSTVLSGNDKLDDGLQQYPELENLWVLPSGPVPPNPAELLSSEGMVGVLDSLRTRFDYVLIDSPPVLAVTDATILSALAEGVIVIAASGSTHRVALARSVRVLESAGAKIIGVVLNKLDFHGGRYGNYAYYHYRGYHSYYPGETTES